jgi:hypothetical protein
MKNRTAIHDNWLTPKDFYDKLNQRFCFDDFDPFPPNCNTDVFDGLKASWAPRTYANPPYSRTEKEEAILKAWEESKLGKLAVLLIPVSTSTKIFHEVIQPYATVEFIRGRLPFEGLSLKLPKGQKSGEKVWHHINPGMGLVPLPDVPEGAIQEKAKSGQHDSMIVVFGRV